MPERDCTVKTIKIRYFAMLREETGKDWEDLKTNASNLVELFDELKGLYHFSLPREALRAAVNNSFCDWQEQLKDGSEVVLVPPVAGG